MYYRYFLEKYTFCLKRGGEVLLLYLIICQLYSRYDLASGFELWQIIGYSICM